VQPNRKKGIVLIPSGGEKSCEKEENENGEGEKNSSYQCPRTMNVDIARGDHSTLKRGTGILGKDRREPLEKEKEVAIHLEETGPKQKGGGGKAGEWCNAAGGTRQKA